MYRAKMAFRDAKDGEHLYNAGDVYPRKGKKVTKARLEELSTENNAAGVAVIVEVKEDPAE